MLRRLSVRALLRSLQVSTQTLGSETSASCVEALATGSARCIGVLPRSSERLQHLRWYRDSRGYEHFRRRQFRLTDSTIAPKLLLVLAGGTVVVWVSCREEVPYTHRKHTILISQALERSIGEAAFLQEKNAAERQGKLLPADHPYSRLIRRVGMRIVEQALDQGFGGGVHSHMQGLNWEFVVIRDEQENAFVTPGGKVVVFTGMLNMLQNEDQLATVLSHEVAHVLGRHVAEKITWNSAVMIGRILLALALGVDMPLDVVTAVVFASNSRALETEADKIGLSLAARACFDPRAFVPVMTSLGEHEAQARFKSPEFLRTHPVSSQRIKQIRADLPAAEALFQQAGCSVTANFLEQFSSGREQLQDTM